MGVKKKPAPVACAFCNALARKHLNLWQCMRNPRHIADLNSLLWIAISETGN
jgi:hypothetical protein